MSEEEKINQEYLSEDFIMRFTGYTKPSIRNYRSEGSNKIPPSIKVGINHVYPVHEFRKWMSKQKIIRSVA